MQAATSDTINVGVTSSNIIGGGGGGGGSSHGHAAMSEQKSATTIGALVGVEVRVVAGWLSPRHDQTWGLVNASSEPHNRPPALQPPLPTSTRSPTTTPVR